MNGMARYKIGVTEAGDAGLDLTWQEKMPFVDGAILITKNIGKHGSAFADAVSEYADKIIVHATVTGYGGTVLEPNVPTWEEQLACARVFAQDCNEYTPFDFFERMVIRVDPIFPTQKGITKAYTVMHEATIWGFKRFRVSIVDMYPRVRERFKKAKLPYPYDGGMYPPMDKIKLVDEMLGTFAAKHPDVRIEACAEPKLTNCIHCGCVSEYDLRLLRLDDDTNVDSAGYQRKDCLCYSGKVELLKRKAQCPHGCLYCYWR